MLLLASCSSDDEPTQVVNNFPSQNEVERIISGKTWHFADQSFVDSRGNSFDWCELSGYTIGLFGFELSGDEVKVAKEPFMQHPYSQVFKWTYDEKTGHLDIGYECYIESISEDEIVLRKDYGILTTDFKEYMDGAIQSPQGDRDPDSYARIVYKPYDTAEKAEEFWSHYPVKEGDSPYFTVNH